MILDFYVDQDTLEFLGKTQIYTGNANYYKCRFRFSQDWDELKKIAVFRVGERFYEQLLEADCCAVPQEALDATGYTRIGIYGTTGGTEEAAEEGGWMRISTNWTKPLHLLEGAYQPDATAPETPTPDVWEQYIAQVEQVLRKQPTIQNGNWMIYDFEAAGYVDTGVRAEFETADGGFAGGNDATAESGGAVGSGAIAGDGFAGGKNAATKDADGAGIDAIQLGTGTNSVPKSLQVYDYQLMDADGNVPLARIPQLSEKVDKVSGKGLSTNDYTDAEQAKLSGIEAGAEVNTVKSVCGRTGAVTLTRTDVGLSKVDNTSDADKPVSAATQLGLDGKVDKVEGKGLSTNDYTDSEKAKVAQVNTDITEIKSELADMYTAEEVDALVVGVYKFKGTISVLPSSGMQNGDVYNMNDDGAETISINTSSFIGGFTVVRESTAKDGYDGYIIFSETDKENLPSQKFVIKAILYFETCSFNIKPILDESGSTYVYYFTSEFLDLMALDDGESKDISWVEVESVTYTLEWMAGDNIAWNGESWDMFGTSFDLSVLDTKADKQTAEGGFCGGKGANSVLGGAVGMNTVAGNGFSGGFNAKTINSEHGFSIDAIQLGTGTNSVPKSLQVYEYQLMDADGNIPSARIPQLAEKADKTELIGKAGTGEGAEIFNDYEINEASGAYSHAEGYTCTASGAYSHAEGYCTITYGDNAHAEGQSTTASGMFGAHAEGRGSTAKGDSAHAEGYATQASGCNSHAEGYVTQASEYNSHAEGSNTTASGENSHAEGYGTTAASDNQHVQGKRNIEDSEGVYAHIVGNGASDIARSNAHTLDWSGNAWFAGKVTVGADAEELATKSDVHEARPYVEETLPEVLALNTIYDLGTQTSVTLKLPSANVGNFIQVDFLCGDTPATFTIDAASSAIVSDYDFTPEPDKAYSLFFDYGRLAGSLYGWRFSYAEYTYTEV